jgi:hypothetical protein
MMHLNLTQQNLERILELLRKNCGSRTDQYLISYLETIKKSWTPAQEIDLDEIPF